jgi:hypothetical protein
VSNEEYDFSSDWLIRTFSGEAFPFLSKEGLLSGEVDDVVTLFSCLVSSSFLR